MARALHLGAEDPDLARAWADSGLRIPLTDLASDGLPGRAIARYVRELGIADEQVTVIVPAPANESSLGHLRRVRAWSSLAASLLDLPNVGVVVVRAHGGEGHHVDGGRPQIAPRRRHVALILVEDLDRAVLKAARYARGIDAGTVRAVHAANDPIRANGLIDRWIAFGYLDGDPARRRGVPRPQHRTEPPALRVTLRGRGDGGHADHPATPLLEASAPAAARSDEREDRPGVRRGAARRPRRGAVRRGRPSPHGCTCGRA